MRNEVRVRVREVWSACLVACVVAIVASCGGGGVVGSGGTGRAASVTVGTVNGFGSVIVDGVTFDDSAASVVAEVAPGSDAVAQVKLGDRVAVEYDAAGIASVVRVDAALAGSVTSVGPGAQFSMLGQKVTVNGTGSVGPITQFGGGYAASSDLHVGDAVEVHALLVRQDSGYSLQATRVDKLASAPAYLRVTGLTSNVNAASAAFSLGSLGVDAAAAVILPAGTVLANGQAVTVLALPASLSSGASGLRLKAAQVRVRELAGGALDDGVSGSIAQLDAGAKTFVLGSLVVRYGAATLVPASAVLGNGQYVLVRGTKAADGSLSATTVTLRDTGSDSEGELKGNISGYVAATKQFTVRGVAVDASTASIQGCPAGGLSDGVFVEVHGALVSTGVMARTVQCQSESSGSTVDRSGVAGTVDTAGKTFTLTLKNGAGTVAVKWADSTYFGDVTPSTLAGKAVQVEGKVVGAFLNASKIELDD